MTSNVIKSTVQYEYRKPSRFLESIDHAEGVDLMDETYFGKFITITEDMVLNPLSSFPNPLSLRDVVFWIHNGHASNIVTLTNSGGVLNGGSEIVPGATVFLTRGNSFSNYDILGGV